MAALWTLMALFGLAAIFSIIPWAYAAAKIAGALYLIYLASGCGRARRNRSARRRSRRSALSATASYQPAQTETVCSQPLLS